MKIFRPFALLLIAGLVCGCNAIPKVPGFSDLSDEEAQKKLYMAENYIELGAYGNAEKELSSFPKNTRHRESVDVLLDRLNEFKVQPDEEVYYD